MKIPSHSTKWFQFLLLASEDRVHNAYHCIFTDSLRIAASRKSEGYEPEASNTSTFFQKKSRNSREVGETIEKDDLKWVY